MLLDFKTLKEAVTFVRKKWTFAITYHPFGLISNLS